MRKGAIGGNLVMLGVFLTATVFGMQSLMIGEAFGQEVSESITDLNRIAQTKSNVGLYFYNYLPMGGEYSTHQASFELSRKGGGEDIEWNSNTIEEDQIMTDAYIEFRDRTREYFNEKYVGAPGSLNCDFTEADFDITPFGTPGYEPGIRGIITAGKPVEAICGFGEGRVRSRGEENYNAMFNASNNRFFPLLNETEYYFTDLNEELQDVDESYEASEVSCGSPPYSDAESSAIGKAEDDMDTLFENVNDSYPHTSTFKLGSRIKDVGGSFKHGSTSDFFEGSTISDSSSDVGCCEDKICTDINGNPYVCGCKEDKYRATVEIEPEELQVDYTLKDDKYRIPVEKGWGVVIFRVDPYTQFF